MKVLQVNATYGIGSTGTIVRDIQKSCSDSGLDCYVAYSLADTEVPKGYKIGNFLSNKIHALLSRISGKQGYFSYLSTLFFIRYLKRLQPDIVHLHNLHANYINLPLLLKYLAKHDIRTIITLHDCWWYTGGCFHYTQVGCDKWVYRCGNCPKKRQDTPAYIYDKSEDILEDRKKYLLDIPRLTIVGVSEWISNEARRSFLSSKQIKTIHNGIDINVFKPTPSSIRYDLGLDDKFIILGPTSKWLQDINKPILDYFAANMKSDEVLLLFGKDDGLLELPSNVKHYGYTKDRFELAALYSSADVFVNVSREDSLSLINLEAQACGTPVVTFNQTGLGDTVNNISSFAIPITTCSELYDRVENLRIHDSSNLTYQCRRFVEENYEINKLYKEFTYLYEDIICDGSIS